MQLGQALAFDKILSGNRDIACMTCHLPSFGTGDGRSLSMGQGGTGFGPARTNGVVIPRNSPAVFNLFAISELFWDGRVSRDQAGTTPHSGRRCSHSGDDQCLRVRRRLRATDASSPIPGRDARLSGNELAAIPDEEQRPESGLVSWPSSAPSPEYRRAHVRKGVPGQPLRPGMTFAHASNAIAGFLIDKLSFNNSPWDRFLRGNDEAMTQVQLQGAKDFMSARCSLATKRARP